MATMNHNEATDIFDDPDLLDFEDPADRARLAAKMAKARARTMPGSVITARWFMFVQPALPILVPLARIAIVGGNNEEEATTTTTAAVVAEEGQRQGGSAGTFLLIALGVIGLLVGVVVVGSRLKRMTSSARNAALALEAVILLGAGAMMVRSFAPMFIALVVSSAAVLALLLSSQTKQGLAQVNASETSSRFDIRSLSDL